ncbi:hypothetical protein LINPERPRIM_LOCUS7119 [Linum perenne]
MTRKLQQLWARDGRVAVWDIGFGHFVARFDEESDFNRAFLEGPWLVVLTLVGNKIGKTVRVDGTTLFGARGNYARICVEIDPHKPLVSKYRLHRRVRRVEYEGLHGICFECGRYDHEKKSCPVLKVQEQEAPTNSVFDNPMFGDNLERPEIVDDYGP